jgi:hypothetical protein
MGTGAFNVLSPLATLGWNFVYFNVLFSRFSLEELTKSNEVLCNRLTHFINEFQDCNLKYSLCNKLKQDKEISSWPMNTLMFHEGKISDWNGK